MAVQQPQTGPQPNQPPPQLTYDERLENFLNAQDPNLINDRNEILTSLDTARDAYAEGIARTSAATFNGHTGDLETLREAYVMWHGVAGVRALIEFDTANELPAVGDPGREQRIRELSAIGVLGSELPQPAATGQGNQPPQANEVQRVDGHDGEANKLARAVELARLQRAGFDEQGQAQGGRFRRAYSRASRWWANRGFIVKTGVMLGLGVGVAAAGATLALTAPAAAAAGLVGGVSISKAWASAHMKNRGQIATTVTNNQGQRVTRAHNEAELNVDQAVQAHNEARVQDADHGVTIEEVTSAFHDAARKRLQKNRARAAVGTVLTVGAVVGGSLLHHDLDNAVDHIVDKFSGHGPHGSGRPEPTSSSRPAASSTRTGNAPKGSGTTTGGRTSATPGATSTPGTPGASAAPGTPGVTVLPAGEVTPHTETVLQHFSAEKTAKIERVWATGTNANDMTHFVNVHGHLEVRLENVKGGETIINGHAINPDTAANVKVAITFNTPNGPEMIFVPMHDGVAVMPDAISKSLLDGTPMDTEIVIQSGASEHLEVLSTVVGHGTEISNSTFNHLVHSSGEASPQPQVPSVQPVEGVPQSAEVQNYENSIYQEFAKTHGGVSPATRAEFNVALSEALSHGQIEFVTNAHGQIAAIVPDAHFDNLAWQNADMNQIQAALQNEVANKTTEGAYAVSENLTGVSHYADQVYQQYLQAHHIKPSPEALKAFNTAFTDALKSNKFEVQVGANGDYSVIAPDPAFDNEIWENIPPRQLLDILSQIEEQNGTLVPAS